MGTPMAGTFYQVLQELHHGVGATTSKKLAVYVSALKGSGTKERQKNARILLQRMQKAGLMHKLVGLPRTDGFSVWHWTQAGITAYYAERTLRVCIAGIAKLSAVDCPCRQCADFGS